MASTPTQLHFWPQRIKPEDLDLSVIEDCPYVFTNMRRLGSYITRVNPNTKIKETLYVNRQLLEPSDYYALQDWNQYRVEYAYGANPNVVTQVWLKTEKNETIRFMFARAVLNFILAKANAVADASGIELELDTPDKHFTNMFITPALYAIRGSKMQITSADNPCQARCRIDVADSVMRLIDQHMSRDAFKTILERRQDRRGIDRR